MAITIGTNGWCTAAQVRVRIVQFSASIAAGTGLVTDTTVEGLITARFRRIQATTLNRGYTAAGILADANALGYVETLNVLGAAADTLYALAAAALPSSPALADVHERQATEMLEDIAKGRVDLGALENDVEAGPSITTTLRTGGTYATPALTKSTVF